MDKAPVCTDEEMAELRTFAAVNGRTWKDDILYGFWMRGIPVRDKAGTEYPTLYRLRNTHGPSWLAGLKID